MSETWLDNSISDREIFVPGYYAIRRDRNRHGGGILLFIRDTIHTASVFCHPTLELIFLEVTLEKGPFHICLCYRPPSSEHFITDLVAYLESLHPSLLKSSLLLGDFNINLLSHNSPSQQLLSSMLSFHLHQMVSEPTRLCSSNSSLIDHIYVSDPSLVSEFLTSAPIGNSDHQSITITLN